MGDKTLFHRSKAPQSPPVPQKGPGGSSREIIWKQISKGELPPQDRQVIALVDYGVSIGYITCYGADLLLGRKQDQYCGAVHVRDWWTVLPPPPGHRFSERLKRIINTENRFEE